VVHFSHLKGINIFLSDVDICENSNPEIFMQYNCHLIKGNNVSREKKLAKKEFALILFSYCLSIIESV